LSRPVELLDARALGPIHLAILKFATINGGKILEFRRRIRPDCLRTFLPIRRTHFTILVLLRPSAPPSTIEEKINPKKPLTVNWNACTRRSASSTERPTGKSLTLNCLSTPLGSIK
jgi:hypothetical protein